MHSFKCAESAVSLQCRDVRTIKSLYYYYYLNISSSILIWTLVLYHAALALNLQTILFIFGHSNLYRVVSTEKKSAITTCFVSPIAARSLLTLGMLWSWILVSFIFCWYLEHGNMSMSAWRKWALDYVRDSCFNSQFSNCDLEENAFGYIVIDDTPTR